jgi:protein-L-isoaspartate(D-aspartate) O-methyltransferase
MHTHSAIVPRSFRRLVSIVRNVAVGMILLTATNGADGQGLRGQPLPTDDQLRKARNYLVDDVLRPAGIENPRVLEAVRRTQRHLLIPEPLWWQAYEDSALPIGEQQTISSPFIVAMMTQSLDPQPDDRVLEIGTGSGFQAAVLAAIVDHVYTIEIVEPLGKRAEELLDEMDYSNISVRIGDGFAGWEEHAPFDKIIVTCSPESVPQPLIDQLEEGGLMVIPVGERYQQTLMLMKKVDGKIQEQALQPTLFVPMTGAAESARQVLPDGSKPALINPDFEDTSHAGGDGSITGWYYGRQAEQSDDRPGEGASMVRFRNDVPGRDSHLMQGLPLDGRKVRKVKLAAKIRVDDVKAGTNKNDVPVVALTFYDSQRREVGSNFLGPFRGTHDWKRESDIFRVPADAREAIVRIGLFGATGTADFDAIELNVVP